MPKKHRIKNYQGTFVGFRPNLNHGKFPTIKQIKDFFTTSGDNNSPQFYVLFRDRIYMNTYKFKVSMAILADIQKSVSSKKWIKGAKIRIQGYEDNSALHHLVRIHFVKHFVDKSNRPKSSSSSASKIAQPSMMMGMTKSEKMQSAIATKKAKKADKEAQKKAIESASASVAQKQKMKAMQQHKMVAPSASQTQSNNTHDIHKAFKHSPLNFFHKLGRHLTNNIGNSKKSNVSSEATHKPLFATFLKPYQKPSSNSEKDSESESAKSHESSLSATFAKYNKQTQSSIASSASTSNSDKTIEQSAKSSKLSTSTSVNNASSEVAQSTSSSTANNVAKKSSSNSIESNKSIASSNAITKQKSSSSKSVNISDLSNNLFNSIKHEAMPTSITSSDTDNNETNSDISNSSASGVDENVIEANAKAQLNQVSNQASNESENKSSAISKAISESMASTSNSSSSKASVSNVSSVNSDSDENVNASRQAVKARVANLLGGKGNRSNSVQNSSSTNNDETTNSSYQQVDKSIQFVPTPQSSDFIQGASFTQSSDSDASENNSEKSNTSTTASNNVSEKSASEQKSDTSNSSTETNSNSSQASSSTSKNTSVSSGTSNSTSTSTATEPTKEDKVAEQKYANEQKHYQNADKNLDKIVKESEPKMSSDSVQLPSLKTSFDNLSPQELKVQKVYNHMLQESSKLTPQQYEDKLRDIYRLEGWGDFFTENREDFNQKLQVDLDKNLHGIGIKYVLSYNNIPNINLIHKLAQKSKQNDTDNTDKTTNK